MIYDVFSSNVLWLWAVCINSLYRDFEALFITPISLGRKLDHGVKGDLDIWQVLLREIVEIGVKTP